MSSHTVISPFLLFFCSLIYPRKMSSQKKESKTSLIKANFMVAVFPHTWLEDEKLGALQTHTGQMLIKCFGLFYCHSCLTVNETWRLTGKGRKVKGGTKNLDRNPSSYCSLHLLHLSSATAKEVKSNQQVFQPQQSDKAELSSNGAFHSMAPLHACPL